MTAMENRWLKYARSVIDVDAEHVTACLKAKGGAQCDGLDQSLRWPGYIGSKYEASDFRLLFVAQTHNPGDLAATIGHFQATMRKWIKAPVSDDGDAAFLTALQSAYEPAMPQWGPWERTFRHFISENGQTKQSVAYTNVAKCWLPPSQPNETQLTGPPMLACNQRFKISELITLLAPAVVVVLLSPDMLRMLIDVPKLDARVVRLDFRRSQLQLDEARRQVRQLRTELKKKRLSDQSRPKSATGQGSQQP